MHILKKLFLGISLATVAASSTAETVYITDQFEVTMRTGMSTANNIVRMLGSGEALELIETNEEEGYSLVETSDGTQGYVISRFLLNTLPARDQLQQLQTAHQALQERSTTQQETIQELTASLDQERTDALSLRQALNRSDEELETLKVTAASAIDIEQQNRSLLSSVETLQRQVNQLTAENEALNDSTAVDWFVKGAAVCLVAFLIGILVTRIRWRKDDSWGSF